VCENYRHLLPQPECAINSANRRPRSRLKGSRRVKIEKSGRSKETAFYCTLRPHESATRGKRKMADNWSGGISPVSLAAVARGEIEASEGAIHVLKSAAAGEFGREKVDKGTYRACVAF
jgi:hypothetical protein